MSQAATKILGAHVGIGNDPELCEQAPSRITSDHDQLREEFFAYLVRCIGQGLTAEQMRALMQPEAQGNLIYRTDTALKMVAGWYMPKPIDT